MYYGRTDDPIRDAFAYEPDEDEVKWFKSRPVCDECGNRITDDYKYMVDDCTLCEECMNKLYRAMI